MILVSVLTLGAAILCLRFRGDDRMLGVARLLLNAAAVAGVFALVVLSFLLVTHDYRVDYVQRYADRAMETAYLLMGVWGGQEGSLLFWAVIQSLFAAGVARWTRTRQRELAPVAIAVMALTALFFWVLTLTMSNPFALSGETPLEGFGMNPLLRNPYMAIHPPTLFVGFAGYAVPMAFALAALATGRLQSDWLVSIRGWVLFAFLFLTMGNVFGMVWAYQVLGWGGYWAWDPVENASLMPWITGTAMLHSLMADERRQTLRGWNVFWSAVTFMLVLFGTFLTRSGVIQSVHAFAGTSTGPWFLAAIGTIAIAYGWLSVVRRRDLLSDATASLPSREGFIRLTNELLAVMVLFIWIATMWPLFMQIGTGEQVSVQPAFFNRWIVPMGLGIAALLGICTLSSWKGRHLGTRRQTLIASLVAALLAIGIATVSGGAQWAKGWFLAVMPLLAIGVVVFAIVVLLAGIRSTLLRGTRRQLGGRVVHLGMMVMVVGFIGAAYDSEQHVTLAPGESLYSGNLQITFIGIRTDVNYRREALYGDLGVSEPDGSSVVFSPARYYFHSHPAQPVSAVAIGSTLRRDLYINLGDVDFESGRTQIRVVLNPLVFWVWAGSILLVLGTLILMIPAGSLRSLLAFRRSVAWPMGISVMGIGAAVLVCRMWGVPHLLLAMGGVLLCGTIAEIVRAAMTIAVGKCDNEC